MTTTPNYRRTVQACYVGNVCQAVAANLTPILLIPLREQFGLSYAQFGFLVLVNFVTQVAVDVLFSKSADKHGYRRYVLLGDALCFVGFLLFALAPTLFPGDVFAGFLLATVLFSGSAGLMELLLSPIVDAIPTKEKDKAMARLHSLYAWGQVATVVLTTLLLAAGVYWAHIVAMWAILPLVDVFLFRRAPLRQKVDAAHAMKIRELWRSPVFVVAFFAILLGGASEVTMAQWTSAFMQKGLALPKLLGDMIGLCGFALMLGVGRVLYGVMGEKLRLNAVLIGGSALAIGCYLVVALSQSPALSIAACVLCGFCVSLLWPGTLVIASQRLPLAGASMFALLAAGGDIGAAVGPYLTGLVTDGVAAARSALGVAALSAEQAGLRAGMLAAAVFPALCLVSHLLLRRARARR